MQPRRVLTTGCLVLLAFSFFMPSTAFATTQRTISHQRISAASPDFPAVDPSYIYDQLFSLVTRFQGREAGYDTSAPNGHKGFADAWTQEMVQDLQGFGPQVFKDYFPIKGWAKRPATSPAFNVEVSVPGATHPEQVVVIGCHYDGEAVSTQSANDDASGCAIELGVAKAMATYWRQHHAYPARTLRFVIFDAEEQGVLGSFHYLNSTINGDTNNIVAMFNEEQNGIAYPLRYLGQLKNPLLPFYIDLSPLKNVPDLYPNQDKLSPTQQQHITHFRDLMQQAIPPVFAQFQALGYQGLTYHGDNKQDVPQPIFAPDQTSYIHAEDDTLGGSDQIPFTLTGLPCATFVGNSSYYDNNPPPWSYPYDQRQDTIQLMNTFADGSSQKSNTLTLSLALPGMLTTWMLNQPDILGQTTTDQLKLGTPIAAIGDIGVTTPNQSLALVAQTAFDPQHKSSAFTYSWDFGDGKPASGMATSHTYTSPGDYILTLTVSGDAGTRTISKTIHVTTSSPHYPNLYEKYQDEETGNPPHNPQVTLPTPNDALSDKVLREPLTMTRSPSPHTSASSTGAPLALIAGIGVALVVIIGLVGGFLFLRRRSPGGTA